MTKIELLRSTSKEVDLTLQERKPLAFVPVGTVEENGIHCPLGKDTLLSEYFAREVAEKTRGYVTPSISFGCSKAFRESKGTIWLRPETLRAMVEDVCESLIYHGFDHIIIVNNHGPNRPSIEAAVRDMQDRHDVCIAVVWPAQIATVFSAELIENFKNSKGHGGEPSTSLMLAICPEDVRMDFARNDSPSRLHGFQVLNSTESKFEDITFNMYVDMGWVSDTGITGDPTGASAEQGQAVLDRTVEWGAAFAKHFESMTPPMKNARPGRS